MASAWLLEFTNTKSKLSKAPPLTSRAKVARPVHKFLAPNRRATPHARLPFLAVGVE